MSRARFHELDISWSCTMNIGQNGIDIAFIDDRRQAVDRRQRTLKTEFPLVDCDGRFIKADRRNTPDRRLSNIQVKELAINGFIFNTLFSSR